jgi:hypothetical protein
MQVATAVCGVNTAAPFEAPTLAFLTERAERIRVLGKRVAGDIIEIGRLLAECKERCGHGHWLPWLEAEFGWTDRTALNFTRVYELSLKSETVSDLDLPMRSLYLLAAPSTPDSARTEVIERAGAGERLNRAEVQAIITAHSPAAVQEAADLLRADNRGIVTGVAMHPYAERGLDLYETPIPAVKRLARAAAA